MNRKQKLMVCIAAICVALFLFSAFMLCRIYFEKKQNERVLESAAGLIASAPEEAQSAAGEGAAAQGLTAEEKYAKVYAANSDFVGWISIAGTNIDYPVMQTKTNPNFYLKHNFEKTYSNYGVPYVQENCDIGLSDNLIIYGHHMKSSAMFSDLQKYEKESFYKQHSVIHFDTLDGYGEYVIIAVFKTTAYSEQGFGYYNFVNASGAAEFNEYIANCKKLALYDTGVTAEYGDKLITLSTCEYSQEEGRLAVVAKKSAEQG